MVDNSTDYLTIVGEIFKLERILLLVMGLVSIYVISKFIKSVAFNLANKIPGKKNKILQIFTLINFVISLGGGSFIVYFILHPSKEVTIALLGSTSVAIGLSLKDLVSSLISGITIITDPPFKVGDFVIYQEIKGHVTHIGLRVVRILNADQQVITIPNSIMTSDFVIVQNPGQSFMLTVTPFYLHCLVSVQQVRNILHEVACTSPYIYLSEKVLITVEQILNKDKTYFKFNVKAQVTQAKYSEEFQADLYHRSFKIFQENKIEFFGDVN
ncbi:MAG: hypothetical protein COY39_00930 [Alphaproteobacteria bacterium CG_4_10_14_0_8_um_filter_37_21]|nr:MAG: hypothetical protein COY39_00930 [Alphaproteobacteria bacterium CG_4_10_14_0_8_um_filter_37_21]